ncbi:MAG: ABC transporter ATP-binding protein [Chitinophagia bacterium]|nr:ABC transporter ATP-binding protein [Chitinophagia bacterium]
MNTKLISFKNVTVSFWQNDFGVHSIKDLMKHRKQPFSNKIILNDVTFDVERGACMAILGRNGSGKSTLLRTIAGLIKPIKGQITINGTFAPILAIGAGVELELSGYENINLLLSLYGRYKRNSNTIQDIIAFSELSHEQLSMPVKRYSSGMVARLAFSISIANDADILIIDEVLAVGDKGFQQKCMDKIFGIKAEGKTILFVSHFTEEVMKICNTALLLDKGNLIDSGTAEEICNKYMRLFP